MCACVIFWSDKCWRFSAEMNRGRRRDARAIYTPSMNLGSEPIVQIPIQPDPLAPIILAGSSPPDFEPGWRVPAPVTSPDVANKRCQTEHGHRWKSKRKHMRRNTCVPAPGAKGGDPSLARKPLQSEPPFTIPSIGPDHPSTSVILGTRPPSPAIARPSPAIPLNRP